MCVLRFQIVLLIECLPTLETNEAFSLVQVAEKERTVQCVLCWAEGSGGGRKIRQEGMGPVNPPTPTAAFLSL